MAESTGTTKKAAAKRTSSSPTAKSETKTSGDSGTGKKRTVLTSEQKIAKLEEELRQAKAKDAEKREKKVNDLKSKRDKAQAKLDELRLEIAELDAEIERNGPAGEALVHPAGLNDDGSPKVESEGVVFDETLNSDEAQTDADETAREVYGDDPNNVPVDGQ